MNLDNVTAELRPRSPWEAADFGARLVRRDAATIYRIWFALTLPLAALAMLAAALGPYPTLALMLYWWIEPVADGPILHVISRRLFGESPSARAALRAAPALAWRNRIFLISPYRFHFARSIAMPLTQLEGMRGRERRARAKVLGPRIMRYGVGVTVAYQHLALALYIGFVLIGFALVPPQYRDTLGSSWLDLFWADEGRLAVVLGFVMGYLAQSALQPWFVGSGFGLYANCRTELEAWDLEIAFRRMAQRRARGLAAAALMAAVLVPMIVLPGPVLAQDVDWRPSEGADGAEAYPWWSDELVRPALDEVMSSDALRMTREVERWQRKDLKEREADELDLGIFGSLLRSLGRALAVLFEFALWIAVAVLVAAAVMAALRWRPILPAKRSQPAFRRRVVLAGGEIRGETLPKDIPGEALKLWRAGEPRRAMSLLYQGSVFAAVNNLGVRLPPSATEGLCIAAVEQQADPAPAGLFRALATAWTWCAYAGRDPTDELVESLCAEWPRHFGARE